MSEVFAKISSPAGNRTPVSRVTGGDTYHYTTEDYMLSYNLQVDCNIYTNILCADLVPGERRANRHDSGHARRLRGRLARSGVTSHRLTLRHGLHGEIKH